MLFYIFCFSHTWYKHASNRIIKVKTVKKYVKLTMIVLQILVW